MDINRVLEQLDKVKQTGEGRWIACCPSHEDKSPSLTISDDGDRLLIHCFAGCDPLDVVHAMGMTMSDLFADEIEHVKSRPFRIRPSEAVQLIDHEAMVVGLIAADLHEGVKITSTEWARLAKAVNKIGQVRDALR